MIASHADANSKTQIRIAYVVNRFDVGGLERYISRMCSNLPRSQFPAEIICLRTAGSASKWIDPQLTTVHELGASRGNDRRTMKKLADLVQNRGIRIVQSHNWGTLLETYFACKQFPKQIRHVHAERGTVLGPDCNTRIRKLIRSLAMRWVLPRVSGVICNAYAIDEKIRELTGLTRLPIEIIPNGIVQPSLDLDTSRMQLRRQLGISENAFVIGFLGRLAPVKNPGLLLEAFYLLNNSANLSGQPTDELKLLVVGDGVLKGELEQKVDELKLQRSVIFAGEQTDSLRWLSGMDVMVNSSLSEGMSQSILEAMSLGIPTIVTDVGDSRRMIGGMDLAESCGLWVESQDVRGMATKLQQLWSHPELRCQLSQIAKERFASEYSIQRMLERHQNYYAKLAI